MSLAKINVIIKSNISVNNNIELTSSMFEYNGVKQLDKYPYFHPSKKYPYDIISKSKFEKVLEFFFNKSVFKKMMNLTEDIEDTENKKFNINDINIQNFEFMIRTLFPDGNISSYKQSISYYDKSKVPTVKNGYGSFFKRMLNKTSKYNIIKVGGSNYTVNNVVWLNDALNIQKYYEVLVNYNNFQYEKKDIDKLQKKNSELEELYLNLFCVDITFRFERYYKKVNKHIRSTSRNTLFHQIREQFEKILAPYREGMHVNAKSIRDFSIDEKGNVRIENNDETITPEIKGLDNFIAKNNLKVKLAHNEKSKSHVFIEYLIKNPKILARYPQLKQAVDKFLSYLSSFKNDIRIFFKTYNLENILDINVPYISSIREYSKDIKQIQQLSELYEYVSQDKNIGNLQESEKKIISKTFPNFLKFLENLTKLYNERFIFNPMWKSLARSYTDPLSSSEINSTESFSKIKQCIEDNMNCEGKREVSSLLYTGIDKLKNQKSTYEAYIFLSLLPGKMNDEKFSKIKCSYYDDVKKSKNQPEESNDFLHNKVKKINNNTKRNKPSDKNKVKRKNQTRRKY